MKNAMFSNVRGDLFGGLTAGIVALPLALAFGLSSGLGPDAGLYGAIFIAFFAALFGGTDTQISGPTAPMTAVSMLIIAGILQDNQGDLEQAYPAILTVFLLAGILLVLLGVIGVGKYIKYIPSPVVSGFMTAIGVIILVTQLLPLMGYYPSEDKQLVSQYKAQAEQVIMQKILEDEAVEGIMVLETFTETERRAREIKQAEILVESKVLVKDSASGVIGAIRYLGRAISNIKWIEFMLALITILIIYGFKRITTAIPSTLVALLVVSVTAYILQAQGVINYRPIPAIPSGFPTFRMDIFSQFSIGSIAPYLDMAVILAFLGAIDSLLTSIVADNMTKTRHKPNQELVGQGVGNSIAALFGGLPGAGATIRTVVNIQAGGKTRLSGMIAGVLLLFILLALGPIASQIPAAVLAGILITVGIGVMDYKGLRAIPHMQKSEITIMFVVLILAVVWNLVYAVGIGLIMAALHFMKKMGDATAKQSKILNLDDEVWSDELDFPEQFKEEVYIKHLNGPLFFGYTNEFSELSMRIPDTATHVVLRMNNVPYIDQSGIYALEDVIRALQKKGTVVLITGLFDHPSRFLKKDAALLRLIPKEHLFDTFEDCIAFIKREVKDII